MAKNVIGEFTLRRASKVFPDKYTRISPHDFLNLAYKKSRFLSKKEKEDLYQLSNSGEDAIIFRDRNKLTIMDFS